MSRVMPEYMTMGHRGMGGMGEMRMEIPPNSAADARRPRPHSYIDMGGMFTVLKVRDDVATADPAGVVPGARRDGARGGRRGAAARRRDRRGADLAARLTAGHHRSPARAGHHGGPTRADACSCASPGNPRPAPDPPPLTNAARRGHRPGAACPAVQRPDDAGPFVVAMARGLSPRTTWAAGGFFEHVLAEVRERFPVVTHGLSLGLGDRALPDPGFLRALRTFLETVGTPWHSDHLCFGAVGGAHLHDLLPLPFTRESVRTVVDRVSLLEDALGLPIAVENISWYAHPGDAEMDEADFLREVLSRSGARLLLDVNNAFVNARNHGADARDFLRRIPADRVVQIHVAGHFTGGDGLRIDTHGEPSAMRSTTCSAFALARTGRVPVLLERDGQYPPFDELAAEVERLDAILQRVAP
jgi:uncharacterized protein (UPF0276 family)